MDGTAIVRKREKAPDFAAEKDYSVGLPARWQPTGPGVDDPAPNALAMRAVRPRAMRGRCGGCPPETRKGSCGRDACGTSGSGLRGGECYSGRRRRALVHRRCGMTWLDDARRQAGRVRTVGEAALGDGGAENLIAVRLR